MYGSKYVSPEKAVSLVKSGDWVDYSFCLGTPFSLDKALAARKDELFGVGVRGGLLTRPLEIIECDPTAKHFSYCSWHLGGYERRMADLGCCSYIPLLYQSMPQLYDKTCHVDVAFITTTPMDKDGYFNFSLTNSANHAIIKAAKFVVIEINEQYPSIGGRENAIHISDIDYVVESGNPAIPSLQPAAPSEIDKTIAKHIMERLQDGAVIQLGIGGLPNVIGQMIADSDLRNLGGHTEMLVDAYATMMLSGSMTNSLKPFDKGKTAFTFALGSIDFYDWVRDNIKYLAPLPVSYTNNICTIAKHEQMIAINSCLQFDLFGQINAESVGPRQISGTGGQLDFTVGAMQSPKGRAFLCCASTRKNPQTGELQSAILPSLQAGSIITTNRSAVDYLVTEWGIAQLSGQSIHERTRRIIEIAHPDFRDMLTKEAQAMKIIRD